MELRRFTTNVLSFRVLRIGLVVAFLLSVAFLSDNLHSTYCEKYGNQVSIVPLTSKTAPEIYRNIIERNVDSSLPICDRPDLSGKSLLTINKTVPSLTELDTEFQHVASGGHWEPTSCRQRQRVAILIPFRDRWDHLPILVRHLHNLLVRQIRHYTIYVIDQRDDAPFNRGQLINIGVNEAVKVEPDLNCFILHDVDTLPENLHTIYKCHEDRKLVSQMATYQKKRSYKAAYRRYTGGVLSIWRRQYEDINGFSNEFWGWGGEDDDLANRLTSKGYDVARDFSRTGYFYSLEHPYTQANPEREDIVKRHLTSLYAEGLNTTTNVLLNVTTHRTFTLFAVDLSARYKEYLGV